MYCLERLLQTTHICKITTLKLVFQSIRSNQDNVFKASDICNYFTLEQNNGEKNIKKNKIKSKLFHVGDEYVYSEFHGSYPLVSKM